MLSKDDAIYTYTGSSMNPGFRSGDEIRIVKSELQTLRLGDVVIFSSEKFQSSEIVVHRIVQKKNQHYLTRGDNNLHLDPEPLNESVYLGKAVTQTRAGKRRKVTNGFIGWLFAQCQYLVLRVIQFIKFLFRPLYAALRTYHQEHPFWHPDLLLLTMQSEDHGKFIKTLYHGRTVATFWVRTGNWRCKKPFDLVLQRPEMPLDGFLQNKSSIDQ